MDLLNIPRLDKRSIKKFANRAAKSYDNAAILHEEVLNRLLERLQYIRHQPETIIDVGSGTGRGVPGLQKTYPRARIYAADIAHEMLLQARTRLSLLSKKRLVAADMEQLPFADQSFDLVFSSLALPWSNDVGATLKELSRVSRPGALLMFSSFGLVPVSEALSGALGRWNLTLLFITAATLMGGVALWAATQPALASVSRGLARQET